jgi:hypothetical protein
MKVADVINHFSAHESVPIDVDDVVQVLRENGVKDDIYFWGVDINDEHLRGTIQHWEWPESENGPLHRVADIYYCKHLPSDWKRLVCCKELLHVLDPPSAHASTPEQVEELVKKIVLAPEHQDPLHDGDQVNSDRRAIYQAVAVLFPWATRQLLSKPLLEGKLTPEDIAKMVDLPARYVRLVMSDVWEVSYKWLASMQR